MPAGLPDKPVDHAETKAGAFARRLGRKKRLEYAAADLFVFSSVTETQGLVLQEAMVHGLPCVAVSGGGASLSIDEGVNGFVVRNEPDTFAGTVLNLLHDDDLYARLSEGAARSGREYGTGKMAERIVEVYEQAIAGRDLARRNLASLR